MSIQITIGIPTKNRYDSLAHTLQSCILQTLKPKEIIIVDDNDYPVDLRENPIFAYLFKLMDQKGIEWKVLFGDKKGQHYSHQKVQEEAKGDWIFRIDDDEVAEPDVLQKLATLALDGVGAVGPAVLIPPAVGYGPMVGNNEIKRINKPNIQWFRRSGQCSAEHLYSCFLYRKGVVEFDKRLSTVAHREETIFTHSIYRAGYQLYVNFSAVVWHFRAEEGGIRSFRHDPSLWEHDEEIFQNYLKEWNVDTSEKFIVLDNGLGDHYAFKNLLPQLREKYKNITIACCYPEVFHDEDDLALMSIAEAKLMFGNIDRFNIYRFMEDTKWTGKLEGAFKKLYL